MDEGGETYDSPSVRRGPTMTVSALAQPTGFATGIVSAATLPAAELLGQLGVTADQGLASDEVGRRQAQCGPNAVSSHRARLLPVLWHQLRSPLLALLVTAAIASYFVGERSGAVIIGVIVALSVGLGFVNEYRAEKAAEALHSQISHKAVVVRDGRPATVDVTTLVPGDLIELRLGEIVPADIRLIEVTGLECDESVLTGESLTVEKNTTPVPSGTPLAELSGCALMGTVVHAGSARGIVVATGARTEFGKIATGLSTHQIDTGFQVGLRRFSMLLVYVAGALTTSIFVINVVLHKPIIDALLFSLAIAVGITPQLLPAVVSTSLAAGSRRMRRRKVLLFTDKTGTLMAASTTCAQCRPVTAAPTRCCIGDSCALKTRHSTGQPLAGTRSTRRCGSPGPPRASGPLWPATRGLRCSRSTMSAEWSRSSFVTRPIS